MRRLAAILAFDMVGSSRLMEADEVGTLAAFKAHREVLIEPAIAEHHGRIVKLTGDGALVEFASAVEAVRCALAIQEGMTSRNEGAAEDRRIDFRIGVHIGDIMVEEEDIYGDGVNIAARLEALAEPGGICISQQLLDHIETKLDLACEDLGERALKNISRPVRVWHVRRGDGRDTRKAAARTGRKGRTWALAAAVAIVLIAVAGIVLWQKGGEDIGGGSSLPAPLCNIADTLPPAQRPGIAVLPFENLSKDPDKEYLGYGLAEDLVTDLSKVCDVRVVPVEDSSKYGGRNVPLEEVSSALGARYLVTGSIRRDGGRVRINARLIDPVESAPLWADRYDGEYEELFDFLNTVLARVENAIGITISEKERQRIAQRGTRSIAAHDLVLRGRRLESFFTCEAHAEAIRLYEQALSIDPNYALPYSRIGNILELNIRLGCSPADLGKAIELHKKAVELDPQDPRLWWGLGRALARQGTPEALADGIKALQYAIEIDQYFADAYAYLAILYTAKGEAEAGLTSVKTAMELNPRYPFWYLFMRGFTNFCLEDYAAAIADLETARDRNPNAQFVRRVLAASYVKVDRVDDAKWEIEELGPAGARLTIKEVIESQPMRDPVCVARYEEGLRKAGVPEE